MSQPKTETGHARRLVSEQLAQLILVASGFFDRLVLTAIVLRFWGIATFEIWSAAIAITALISLFELGFNIYFNNQMTMEMERGDVDTYRRTLASGNTIFAATGVLALILALGFIWTSDPTGSGRQLDAMLAASALCIAASARISLCAVYAMYRANREYARFAFLSAFAEFLRVIGIVASVVLGAGLLGAAIVSASITIAVTVVFVLVDTNRRFHPHKLVFGWPARHELRRMLSMSLLYLAQLIPVILWTSLPVLYLQNLGLASGMLAGFVLIRTLANIARTPMQSLGTVFGQECGRCIAVGDLPGALRVLQNGARLFAVTSGLMSGLLLIGGAQITKVWTGSTALYDPAMMAAAIIPMALVTATLLVHNVLMCAQAPARPAAARWVQLLVSVVTYLLLPGLAPPLRMMVALAAGEIAGYAPVAYDAMARLIPGSGIRFHVINVAAVLASIGLGGGTMHLMLMLFGTADTVSIILALAVTGLLFALYILVFGIGRKERLLLLNQFILPTFRRFRFTGPPR